ncbi:MAG TPA: hypothetical protein PLN42_00310 [Anaerolineae bacterium]|nr:hypothetical protein [Anaerolineae bacterium]
MFERYPELRQVIVTTKTDRSIRGLLWRRRRGYLVLKQAELLRAKAEPVAMDGDVVIEAANVDFVQVFS